MVQLKRGFLYLDIMWKEEKGKLKAKIACENFMDALQKLNKIAELAEERQHHPDVRIFNYKMLEIELYTHSSNSITDNDHELAELITKLLIQ